MEVVVVEDSRHSFECLSFSLGWSVIGWSWKTAIGTSIGIVPTISVSLIGGHLLTVPRVGDLCTVLVVNPLTIPAPRAGGRWYELKYQGALLLDSRCFLRLPGKNVTDLASTQAILDLRRRAEMCKWLGLLIQNYNGNIYISTQGSIIMVINKQLKFPFWLTRLTLGFLPTSVTRTRGVNHHLTTVTPATRLD